MKKILSLALASAMVLSMAAVAFAADSYKIEIDATIGSPAYLTAFAWDDDDGAYAPTPSNEFAYGDTVLYALKGINTANSNKTSLVYEYDAVKGLKLKPTWSMGGSLVEKVEIVKKKIKSGAADGVVETLGAQITDTGFTSARAYAYFVAVTLKDSTSTKTQFVSGKIEFAKSKGKNPVQPGATDALKYDDHSLEVALDVTFNPPATSMTADKDKQLFTFNNDEEDEIILIEADIATFTVDTRGQDELVISATNKFDADIAAKYDANMNFLKTNGATFNRTGELKIFAEEGSYLYEIKADGTLVKSRAKYDDYEEAFVLKTRTLGSYVIADEELKVGAAAEEVEVVVPGTEPPVANPNPGTGAAC